MENKESLEEDIKLIKERIAEIEGNISTGRHTGRTYNIANKMINDFFNLPIGSKILVANHDSDNSGLLKLFVQRMRNDFPKVNFTVEYPQPGIINIIRLTPTYKEVAQEKITKWKNKLKEMNYDDI